MEQGPHILWRGTIDDRFIVQVEEPDASIYIYDMHSDMERIHGATVDGLSSADFAGQSLQGIIKTKKHSLKYIDREIYKNP